MRNKPTYDWNWFTTKAPFKKIFEDMCDLKITKEIYEVPVISSITQKHNHYIISLKYSAFESEFNEIKERLLNTNIAKNNTEVYSLVNEMQCSKKDLCELIIDSCIPNCLGTFTWNFE